MKERVIKVLSIVFQVPVEKMDDNLSPDSIKTWDSLSHMKMVVALEEEFDIEFKDEELSQLLNFKLIMEILREKV